MADSSIGVILVGNHLQIRRTYFLGYELKLLAR